MEFVRIHTQKRTDECSSCALAALVEHYVQQPVDSSFIYDSSKDKDTYGILPSKAVAAVMNCGVKLEDTGEVIKPFKSYWKVWSWFGLFNALVRVLPNGPLFCGCYWQPEWEGSKQGIVSLPKVWYRTGAHAFCVKDVVTINGIMYLKVQNSRGENSGDHGFWYFPKEVVNKFLFAYQFYEED